MEGIETGDDMTEKEPKDPNILYPHKVRVAQLHRWLKKAERANDSQGINKIKLRMKLLGIEFYPHHPEYLGGNKSE